MKAVLFDLDQTLIDSTPALPLRDKRQWNLVYPMIPSLRPYDGIPELLKELRSRQVSISIVTSAPSSYCNRVLRQWNWDIQAVVCYHDTLLHKPHPEPILKALEKLGVQASQAISVGDRAQDTLAARAAGVFTVGALWGSDERQTLASSHPDALCKSTFDLAALLLEGNFARTDRKSVV